MSVLNKNALFIHVPKTAGTKLRTTLVQTLGGKHYHQHHDDVKTSFRKIKTVENWNDDKIKTIIPYCFIRHPVTFIYSQWAYWTQYRASRPNGIKLKHMGGNFFFDKHIHKLLDFIVEGNLEATINRVTTRHPDVVGEIYDSYTKDCKYIGKQENLYTDLFFILDEINPSILTPSLKKKVKNSGKVNVSKKFQPLTQKMIDALNESEQETIKKYEYENYKIR